MNDSELVEIERSLRAIFPEAGLQWILDQVDTSIDAGITEEGQLSIHRHEIEFLRGPISGSSGLKAASTNRPYSPAERLDLLLTSLERAATELPEIHSAMNKALTEERDDGHAPIQTVAFLPDEDASRASPPPSVEVTLGERAEINRSALVRAIIELREVAGE